MGCKLGDSKPQIAMEISGALPSHSADLEVTQMRPVLLLGPAGELMRQELHGTHRRNKVVNMVLCEVADPETAILCDVTCNRLELAHEELDPL